MYFDFNRVLMSPHTILFCEVHYQDGYIIYIHTINGKYLINNRTFMKLMIYILLRLPFTYIIEYRIS